jgi:hypothetical protein
MWHKLKEDETWKVEIEPKTLSLRVSFFDEDLTHSIDLDLGWLAEQSRRINEKEKTMSHFNKMTIPKDVTHISNKAFSECKTLTGEITEVLSGKLFNAETGETYITLDSNLS